MKKLVPNVQLLNLRQDTEIIETCLEHYQLPKRNLPICTHSQKYSMLLAILNKIEHVIFPHGFDTYKLSKDYFQKQKYQIMSNINNVN